MELKDTHISHKCVCVKPVKSEKKIVDYINVNILIVVLYYNLSLGDVIIGGKWNKCSWNLPVLLLTTACKSIIILIFFFIFKQCTHKNLIGEITLKMKKEEVCFNATI